MREIKFRAWDGSKMHLPEYSDDSDFVVQADGSITEYHEVGYERHLLRYARSYGWVIMQYVGISDKNKNDAYEGDITHDGVIEYNAEVCCYIIRRTNRTFIRLEVRKNNFEIIGNIYETPSLLHKDKDVQESDTSKA